MTETLPQLTERAIGLLLAKWHDQDKRIQAYKEIVIKDAEVREPHHPSL